MRLIFHNTSDASQVTGDTPGSVTEKDLEEGLKARDEDLEQLRASLSSVRDDVSTMSKRISSDLEDARRTIGSQERQLVCAQDLYKFSSEQSKLIANYWQGQAKMKDENIVFFNQKLADAQPMTSTSSSAVAGRFPSPATKEDEFSCLQDRHDKLLTTCMRLEEELRLLRKHHDKMGDGRHRAEVSEADSASESSSSPRSVHSSDQGVEQDSFNENTGILKRSSSEPSCSASALSPSSHSRRASSLDRPRGSSSFSSITSDSSDDIEGQEITEAVKKLHHCTWRAQLKVRIEQLERLSKQLDDTYNTSLNLGDQLRQQSEQMLQLQQRNDELERSEKKWQKLSDKAQTQLNACLTTLAQQSTELERLAEKGSDHHRLTRTAAAWNAKTANFRKEVESIQLAIEDMRLDLSAESL